MNRHLNKMFSVVTILALMLMALPMQSVGATTGGSGSISLTASGTAYTQNFDTLANTGTANNLTINGWFLDETGTSSRNNGAYSASTGSDNAGDIYSFGATGSTERAYGTLRSGTLVPIIGAGLTNNTGDVITSLLISFTGEQWRAGVTNRGAADRLDFQLSTNATSLTTGTWVDYDGLDFNSPNTISSTNTLDGNATGNRAAVSFTITDLNIVNGSSFWIRWTDFDISSSDDGLGIDDFSLTPNGGDTGVSLSINDVSANEGDSGTTSFDFTVSLSAPAGPGGVAFEITTADNTATVADNDYVANSAMGATIPEGSSTYPFSVMVNGDTTVEPNETFFVNVTNVTGATLSDGQGVGTIQNDDITITPIYDIQGAGHVSPYMNQVVTTTGVVTAVAFDSFYVQDPVGDGDNATADGIFVFMGNFCNGCPDVGDFVRMSDQVTEFIPGGASTGNLSTTQMSFPNIMVLSSGNNLPEPVVIGLGGRVPPNVDVISADEISPPINLQLAADDAANTFDPANDGIDFYESLEGMLVTVEDAVAVSAIRSFGTFSSELFTLPNNGHPEIIEPNNARTDRGGININVGLDGYGDLNPERVQIQFDASDIGTGTLYPGRVPEINLGDRLGDVTGVMNYDFGNFEVRATEVVTVTPSGLQPESTTLVGTPNEVTVASYNVFNLSPLSSDDSQRAKLASQIVNNLGSPDVIALQEIQDNSGETDDGTTAANETLQALADAITAAGGPAYEFLDVPPDNNTSGGVPGGNIRNAFLYNPDRVELDSYVSLTPDVLEAAGADPDAFFDTRNPLAATFIFGGEAFTVINNHLSSRSGSTPIFGGPQPFVQAAEDEREAQTQALNDYVDFLLSANKNARVIVTGDFNTFEFTDDLMQILPGTLDGKAILKELLSEIEDDNRYSYIFEGNSQVLDHMFATRSLLDGAEFDIVHVNVDFSFRRNDIVGSDHEPLVARFHLR